MSGIPVFLLHFLYESKSVLLFFHQAHRRNKPGFLLRNLPLASCIDGLIFFQHTETSKNS